MPVFTVPQVNYTAAGNPRTFGPVTVPGPISKVEILANIPTADYEAAGAGFDVVVQASGDNFATHLDGPTSWSNPAGGPVVSSKGGPNNPPPYHSVTYSPPLAAGWEVRAVFNVHQNMKIGWTITVT